MKSYLALAWKELKAQKITAILILVAVIMSTIMTTVIGQSIGILQSMRIQQAAGLNGNRYATFHQLGKEQAQKLHEDDRLYDVGDTIFIGSTPLGNSSLSLYLREYHDNALSMYPAIGNVKEGRLPEEAIEIALSEDALQYLGLDAVIGDTVSLDLSVSVMDGSLSELEYSADFVLTGILESSYIGYASGTVEGIVGEGTAEELLPEEYLLYSTDFKTYDKQNFQSIIYALAEDLNVDERYIQYNWVLLDAIGISYDEAADSDTGTGFSFMTAACILVGVLVLLAAGLVIYNILKISITKRIKEYGTLRAIGGERGQIYRLVSLQLLILCGAGIPIGLLLGILSAKGVLIAATGLLNPDLFMANSTSELNSAINTASTVKLPMATIPLFANWTWKRSLPEPFDKVSGTTSTTHYSTYCIVSTKKSTLHPAFLSALLAYMDMDTTLTPASTSECAIGTQDDKIVAEYKSRTGETHVVVFNKKNGKFKGYAQVTKVRFIRALKDSKGNARKIPWYVEVENGKGIPLKNATGGTYMKSGSFVSTGRVYANLTDLDLFRLLSRVSSYIDAWEHSIAPSLITMAKKAMENRQAQQNAA